MSMKKAFLYGAGIFVLLGAGFLYWGMTLDDGPPPGFATANGRIEAERVDVTTKFSGRLKEVMVSEGDRVEEGAVLARLGDTQLRAQLREAQAQVGAARQALAERRAILAERKSTLTYAEKELFLSASIARRSAS